MKFGHVLVIDEADKAPTNVTCILKSLVESGEMVLGDGRRIVSGTQCTWMSNHIVSSASSINSVWLQSFRAFTKQTRKN